MQIREDAGLHPGSDLVQQSYMGYALIVGSRNPGRESKSFGE